MGKFGIFYLFWRLSFRQYFFIAVALCSWHIAHSSLFLYLLYMAVGFSSGKVTGFASPAQGYEENTIDLNTVLIKHPSSTYLFRLESSDMAKLGLPSGALLIVDRSIKPFLNQFALLRHEGQFLCRLMVKHDDKIVFTDGTTETIPIADETEIIGAVTASIQEYKHDFSY